MRPILLALLPLLIAPVAALAQKESQVLRAGSMSNGLREHLGTTCVSPIYYEVDPTNGEACKLG